MGSWWAPFLGVWTLCRILEGCPLVAPVGPPDRAALTATALGSSGLRSRSTRMSTVSEVRITTQENDMEVELPASSNSRKHFSVPSE